MQLLKLLLCALAFALALGARTVDTKRKPLIGACPDGNPPVQCTLAPCDVESCPGRPDATCSSNYCGGCNAVFTDSKGNVVPKFSCVEGNQWPQCLLYINCALPIPSCETGCPGVPDAVCSLTCSCEHVFTDKDTGNLLTSDHCSGSACPDGNPPVQCKAAPCDVESCPGRPDATCTNNYCGGCNAVFTDSEGNVIPKFSCVKGNRWPQCLLSIRCAFPITSCENDCPGVPDAVCSFTCSCGHFFTDKDTGNLLTSDQCSASE